MQCSPRTRPSRLVDFAQNSDILTDDVPQFKQTGADLRGGTSASLACAALQNCTAPVTLVEQVSPTEQVSPPRTAPLAWRAHPARHRPGAAGLAGLAVAAVALASAAMGGVFWGLVALIVLPLSLSRFFFPSRFLIDSDGVTATYLLGTGRLAWPEIRRFCYDRHGLYLSTRSRRSRLDAYRGLHLLFGAHREEVLRRVRAAVGHDGRPEHVPAEQTSEVFETSEVSHRDGDVP